jgi:hypothetical protein
MLGGSGKWLGAAGALGVLASAIGFAGCDEAIGTHSLTISASPAQVGESVTFTARGKVYEDEKEAGDEDDTEPIKGELLAFKWDLDGNGTFEETQKPVPTDGSDPNLPASDFTASISRSYGAPQTVPVTSLISLSSQGFLATGGGDVSTKQQTLVVNPAPAGGGSAPPPQTNRPPLASFTASPNPVEPHQQVQFDASGSSDADGSIVKYEWDIDAVGNNFERDTGTNPRTSAFYDNSGTYRVGLRVTDDDGVTATTTRDVVVRFSPRTDRVARRASNLASFSLTPDGRDVNPGVFILSGDQLILDRAKARGTIPATGFPQPLRGSHDVRWAADYVVTRSVESGEGEAEAWILLTFATGGRACLGATMWGLGTDDPRGSFRVVGGIGKAARLRGVGTAEPGLADHAHPTIEGQGRFRLADSPDFGLGRSKCGPLRRLAPQRD